MNEPNHAPQAPHLHGLIKGLRSSSPPTAHHGPNGQDSQSHGIDADAFSELMAEVMATAEHFGHRQHIQLTWLAVRRYGTAEAVDLVSNGIQRTARYAGAPQKYNATVSQAWVELVGHHAAAQDVNDFAAFAEHHAALLNKRLLARFYRPTTLASAEARTGWVEPDLAAFPWQH
ncbi:MULTISPECIES: hypothetical protein [unclassified Streptomyces]|uniref:hypothetical protein n=1 Tax=unclassified Streptomyces TaxID=2593676 RepID=UPI0033A35AA3